MRVTAHNFDDISVDIEENNKFSLVPLLDPLNSIFEKPSTVGPVLDPEHLNEPLSRFSAARHDQVFGCPLKLDSESSVPPTPESFVEKYLQPTLSKNEHLRLAAVWYYTYGLNDNAELLQRLAQILEMVKIWAPWEICLIGFVEANTFSRVVTGGTIPSAVIPRRESPCSHTINQTPGTVFSIKDMSQDWRFAQCPTAEHGGLRSYAGTPIQLRRHDGESVSLGSLCLASLTVQTPLTQEQKRGLIRAADIISGELVTSTKLRRSRDRQMMRKLLGELNETRDNVEQAVFQALARYYPDAENCVATPRHGYIEVNKTPVIPLSAINDGLWENTDYIMQLVESADLKNSRCPLPVRTIVSSSSIEGGLLSIVSFDVKLVFDGLDAWFVDQCAHIIGEARQANHLKAALEAKERFMSTIRHELRTPIHGVLSSVELLIEELKSRGILDDALSTNDCSLDELLFTIQSSGNELMNTINNILKWNAITTRNAPTPRSEAYYDLSCIEAHMLREIATGYTKDLSTGISIQFQNDFPSHTEVNVDWQVLTEVLKAIIFNGLAATHYGTIIIRTTARPESDSLFFDIIDNGIGIGKDDHERIFQPFEKVDLVSKGPGLGLSLASLLVSSMKGKVSLVSSQIGKGAHFRVELGNVHFARNRATPVRNHPYKRRNLSPKFCVVHNSQQDLHMLLHFENHLVSSGMHSSEDVEGSVILMNRPDKLESYDAAALQRLANANRHVIFLVSSSPPNDPLSLQLLATLKPHTVILATGPFSTVHLNDFLLEAEKADIGPEAARSTFLQSSKESRHGGDEQISNLESTAQLGTTPTSSNPTPSTIPSLPTESSLLSISSAKPIKALLVDDNNVNLSILQMYCKKRGITYESAVNGNQAVSLFIAAATKSATTPTTPFTLVLMDLQMPVCDGIEATEQIRAYEKATKMSKSNIFMVTGQDSAVNKLASFNAGVDEYFCKPLTMKLLTQAIEQYFPDFAAQTNHR